MLDDIGKTNDKIYKSPIKKLVKFFEISRNKWKVKCQDVKYKNKLLKNKIRYLERRKADLNKRVKELEKELGQSSLKKNLQMRGIADRFNLVPAFHKYSIDHIHMFILLILSGRTGLRGASRVFEIISSFLDLGQLSPSWYSGRLWLLRIGYYKLCREKEIADDWIWIIDHTIQLGNEKCLVILGIRQSSLPSAGLYLNHEDVEPISLLPVKKSNGEVVYQQLEQAIEKTGVPREIISDHGTDVKSGIERFCQEHEQTCFIYDIKHKVAAILKRELKDDQDWSNFVQNASKTSKRVQQTSLAQLAPPNQRSKARYLNVDTLVTWGQDMLCYLDCPEVEVDGKYDLNQINDKLGWLNEYREHLAQWWELIDVVKSAENYIKFVGIYRNCHIDLSKELDSCLKTNRAIRVRNELIFFAEQLSLNAREGERLLGSSEIIESVIGKFKSLEQDQSKSGFTAMILSLASMLSETTQDVIQKAIESVPTKKVFEWVKENIGQSVQSKKKEVLSLVRETEQIRDQNMATREG